MRLPFSPRRKRIAFVTTQRYQAEGGSEQMWLATAEAAMARHWPVLCLVPGSSGPSPRIDALMRNGAIRVALPPIGDSCAAEADALSAFAPDAILISQARAFELLLYPDLVPAIESLGCPYTLLAPGEGGIASADAPVARRLHAGAAGTGLCSRHHRDRIEQATGASLPRFFIMPEPVNLPSRSALPWPRSEEVPRLAHVSRMHWQKGFDVLLDTLADPAIRARSWQLDLFGAGEHLEAIASRIHQLGLGARMAVRGPTDDIRAVWRGHHAFVLASPSEGVPLAMREAMLCGRPAIVTPAGGIPEWIEDGHNGFLARGIGRDPFREAMIRALDRVEDWPRMGRAARRTARQRIPRHPGKAMLDAMIRGR